MPTPLISATATPHDVIATAYDRSPHAFITYLRGLADQHAVCAQGMNNVLAKRSELSLAASCLSAAKVLTIHKSNAADILMKDMPLWMPAYDAACHVLDVPRLARHDIVVRWEARKATHTNSQKAQVHG